MTGSTPAGPSRCHVCGAGLSAGADRCGQCGTSQFVGPCPHCRAIGTASAHDELRYACDVCGGPRVPVLAGVKLSGKEILALKAAEGLRRSRSVLRTGAIAAGLSVPFVFVLLVLIKLIFGAPLLLLTLLTCGPLAALSAWTASRAQTKTGQIPPALDVAWLAAATDVARQSRRPLTAAELASTLRIDEPRAEELLALLEADDVVRGQVTGSGEVAYDSRLRIAEAGAAAAAEAQAEAEAALTAAETRDPSRAKR